MTKRTENLRIEGFTPLPTPAELKALIPQSDASVATVSDARDEIVRIMRRESQRLLVVVGPCSIHDPRGALDYARRLKALADEVADRMLLVMRVYFEKPRTSIGWKGLINDPLLDDSCDMHEGLRRARSLLAEIVEMGLPTAGEMLDPITPHYLADLISWGAVGARTTESQTHRELASGVSFPVGFKNGTNGNLRVAVNAMQSARRNHRFLGINEDGFSCVVHTRGNPHVHVVLRGGDNGPNYDPVHISRTEEAMHQVGLDPVLMVDCSHANSGGDPRRQEVVAGEALRQIAAGNTSIIGLMIESNLKEGNQPIPANPADLEYGVSITDKCIDWPTTERMIRSAHDLLSGLPHGRRAR
jgi:3-deoxy-7-phosphoheptulonate synthase